MIRTFTWARVERPGPWHLIAQRPDLVKRTPATAACGHALVVVTSYEESMAERVGLEDRCAECQAAYLASDGPRNDRMLTWAQAIHMADGGLLNAKIANVLRGIETLHPGPGKLEIQSADHKRWEVRLVTAAGSLIGSGDAVLEAAADLADQLDRWGRD